MLTHNIQKELAEMIAKITAGLQLNKYKTRIDNLENAINQITGVHIKEINKQRNKDFNDLEILAKNHQEISENFNKQIKEYQQKVSDQSNKLEKEITNITNLRKIVENNKNELLRNHKQLREILDNKESEWMNKLDDVVNERYTKDITNLVNEAKNKITTIVLDKDKDNQNKFKTVFQALESKPSFFWLGEEIRLDKIIYTNSPGFSEKLTKILFDIRLLLIANPDTEVIFLGKRFGSVKSVVKMGVKNKIVPFTFGGRYDAFQDKLYMYGDISAGALQPLADGTMFNALYGFELVFNFNTIVTNKGIENSVTPNFEIFRMGHQVISGKSSNSNILMKEIDPTTLDIPIFEMSFSYILIFPKREMNIAISYQAPQKYLESLEDNNAKKSNN